MKFDHIVITRFSYRNFRGRSNQPKTFLEKLVLPDNDPLNPARLESRFRLFEISCLPTICQQTNQDFAWVIVIDQGLPLQYRERLKRLIQHRPQTHLHEFSSEDGLKTLDWLQPYLQGSPDYVITTNLDDDDALPREYIGTVQAYGSRCADQGQLPPLKVVGNSQVVEWDLTTSPQAPLGWTSPWHRNRLTAASCGLTLFSQYPKWNLSILSMLLQHKRLRDLFDFANPNPTEADREFRARLQAIDPISQELYNHTTFETIFHDVGQEVGPVLMINHTANVQTWRLYESKEERSIVAGRKTFPSIAIDWLATRHYADYFAQNRRILSGKIRRIFFKLFRKLKLVTDTQ